MGTLLQKSDTVSKTSKLSFEIGGLVAANYEATHKQNKILNQN